MGIFFLRNPDCVFIHIPKTGGTSIRKGVWKGNYLGPFFGVVPQPLLSFPSFAFVRHPMDRLASAYRMFTDGTSGDASWRMPSDYRRLTPEEFSEIVLDQSIIYDGRRKTFEEKIRHHTIPQTHPFNALAQAKFVGRYERFAPDFSQICKLIGQHHHSLPKMHFTAKKPWREYFSPALIQKFLDYYETDFQVLGYDV